MFSAIDNAQKTQQKSAELAARLKLAPALFLPSVTTVIVTLADLIGDGSLPLDLAISLYRAFAGLALATLVGGGARNHDGAQPHGARAA